MDTSSGGQERMPLIVEGASRLGFTLTEHQVEQFQLYYEMLADWNSRVNLTAITGYDEVQVRHFLDSLTVGATLLEEMTRVRGTRALRPPEGFAMADIGTGAGFPGVPLKIVWPEVGLVLADSIGKKTRFLEEVVSALGLDGVEVITARAETMGLEKAHRERYDCVTARAVASLAVLCEYCLPLAKVGGWMLAPKKGDISQELEEAVKAVRVLGGGALKLHPFNLVTEDDMRYVVAVRKVGHTPPGYPRRVGLAKTRPVGR